jgi:integrase/recombinase XerD
MISIIILKYKKTRKGNNNMNEGLLISKAFIPERRTNFSRKYFQIFIKDSRVKPKTMKNYLTYLKPFAEWIAENNISEPTRQDIREFQGYLDSYISEKTGKALETTSKQQYFQVVKTFFKFLQNEDLYRDITEGLKSYKIDKEEERKRAFTTDEIKTILSSLDTTTPKGKRDYAIILLCITGGLRIIEIQRANIEDLELIDNQARLWIQGKGKDTKNQYVKIIPEVAEAIRDYLSTRINPKKSEALFTSTSNRSTNERIAETSISRLLKTIFKKSGFNSRKLTPHSLRHSSSNILYEITSDIEKVREHSRHSDISTTQIYINHYDREKNNFEQQIFNQIFREESEKERKQLLTEVNQCNKEELMKVARYIQTLKEIKL